MAKTYDLDPVTRITAGAVGEPGRRTFYLQARKDDLLVSLVLEKQQVEQLCRHVEALLARLSEQRQEPLPVAEPDDLPLEEPLVPEFRVGPIALGYDAERDLVLLQCTELSVEDEEEEGAAEGESGEDDPLLEELRALVGEERDVATARFWATRAQIHALARYGARVVAAGRPLCKLCGLPIDPDGHFCAAVNGHRGFTDLD